IVDVLANDSDVDGDSLLITSVTQGTHGSVVNAGGSVTYTPGLNFNGSDSFSYTISDGHGGTASATVSVNVTPVNDPPVAVNDTASTTQNTAVTVNVLANDSDVDGDTLSVSAVTQGAHGGVVINADNTLTYMSTGNFTGTDFFNYSISDGHGGTAV